MENYIQQLVSYLKKNLSKGYTLESLRWALVNQGYSRSEVSRAIKITNEELAKEAPKLKEKPVIKYEREPILEEIAPKAESFFKKLWKTFKELFTS